jgi:heptosyltransferase-2
VSLSLSGRNHLPQNAKNCSRAINKLRSGKRILIVLIAGIGDVVLASKSIRAVRNSWPAAEIHLLTSTEAAPIARHYSYLDHVWKFPMRELRKKKSYLFNMLQIALDLRKLKFDACLNLYRVDSRRGAFKMGLLFLVINARDKIGINSNCFGLFLDQKAPAEIYKTQHAVEAMTDIASLVGARPDGNGIEAFWSRESEKKWRHLFQTETDKPDRFKIGINPGGDRRNRRWPPNNYAQVANRLIGLFDAQIFLLGGPGEESISCIIEQNIQGQVINLAGKLTPGDLTFIISNLNLLITNDSGPMHIAAAVKTRLIGVFGPENSSLFSPYAASDFYHVISKDVDCRPCSKNDCSTPVCLERITPDEVTKCSRLFLEQISKQ